MHSNGTGGLSGLVVNTVHQHSWSITRFKYCTSQYNYLSNEMDFFSFALSFCDWISEHDGATGASFSG